MKLGIIFLISIVAGIFSGEHYHSFVAGFAVAAIAVGSGYWLAFRSSTRYPQLALLMLLLGLAAKMVVTVVGVMWSLEANLINSPIVFSLSYLFFSIVVTYGYSKLREYQMQKLSVKEKQKLQTQPA
ncbi:NADH:ubiquinone oxidoreductase [Photobacterium sanguinicancri]|uniref:NADH:ubiquinone oxidoreductase n=1 Tax=Photobacterium sanguinicancri TaxID=875932 RepID=A0ABX4FXD5_9GAMM|nr:NADH:ubiquinone oxidoreductase [Photobacterium sanguinicancri]MDO6499089.1 NADH:ubiquinone oxidoreductase [Photobacterium sanguinicancri]OZS43544.1 NADH:ubiquinone oxidoreductase [Photobacterium sanguinicancri]